MTKKFKYIRVNPAGNITGFVLDFVEPKERPIIANKIIKDIDSTVEQVGFISKDESGNYRMDMMGGEFCGNATRSFGLYLAMEEGLTGRHKKSLRVSGAEKPVTVSVDVDEMEAEIYLSPAYKTEVIDYGIGNYFTVFLEGIIHIIVTDKNEDKDLAINLINKLREYYQEDAYGVMFLDVEKLTMVPYVYVSDMDTLIRESSCGSGSVAAAYYLNKEESTKFNANLVQPGGTIEVKIGEIESKVTYSISSKVDFGKLEELEIRL